MTAPRTGPLIRAHGDRRARRGGRWSASCPARPRARGARRPGRAGPRRAAGSPRGWRRRPRPARAPRARSAAGGRQSTRLTSTPRAPSASAKRSTPALTTRELGAEQPALSGHGVLPRGPAPARQPAGSSGRHGRPPARASLPGRRAPEDPHRSRPRARRPRACGAPGARGPEPRRRRRPARRPGRDGAPSPRITSTSSDADVAIAPGTGEGRIPEARIDDRMRPPPRVLRVAEVDELPARSRRRWPAPRRRACHP